MSAEIIPFNPLDKKNLGAAVADALLAQKAQPLGQLTEFIGAGVYAIYYTGPFPAYQALSSHNASGQFLAPIYIGKAVPTGSRKGAQAETVSKALYRRLQEHAESIRQADNLDINDFNCRFLAVDDIWIPLGETLLISKFCPVWNQLVDGFGNHDPGSGRYNGMRPRWDVLHPGRAWAMKCKERPESAEMISQDITTFLSNATFYTNNRFYS